MEISLHLHFSHLSNADDIFISRLSCLHEKFRGLICRRQSTNTTIAVLDLRLNFLFNGPPMENRSSGVADAALKCSEAYGIANLFYLARTPESETWPQAVCFLAL